MDIVIRDFTTIVNAIINRMVNANIGITNTSESSFVRILTESIAAELDILNYQVNILITAMRIDTATGEDLDAIIEILGVTRNAAASATGTEKFYTTYPNATDVPIPSGTVVGTRQDANGNIIEVVTTTSATLVAGQLSVNVAVRTSVPGAIYIPAGSLVIMNSPIVGISGVTNESAISGGSDIESDASLRVRAKAALAALGKGTISAIVGAIQEIDGVMSVLPLDMNRGVGTADMVVSTYELPPSSDLLAEITAEAISAKSAGIDVGIIIPTVTYTDVVVTTTGGDTDIIGEATMAYSLSLHAGDTFRVDQLKHYIMSACGVANMGVIVSTPDGDISADNLHIVRVENITINGVAWDGE